MDSPFEAAQERLRAEEAARAAKRSSDGDRAASSKAAMAGLCRDFLARMEAVGFPGTRTFDARKGILRRTPGHECYVLVHDTDSDGGDQSLILSTAGLTPRGVDEWIPIEEAGPIQDLALLTTSMARVLNSYSVD